MESVHQGNNSVGMKKRTNRSFNLLSGTYSRDEAIDLLTRIIFTQIKFHESKINAYARGEDISEHRRYIADLQQDLYDIRQVIDKSRDKVSLNSALMVSEHNPNEA